MGALPRCIILWVTDSSCRRFSATGRGQAAAGWPRPETARACAFENGCPGMWARAESLSRLPVVLAVVPGGRSVLAGMSTSARPGRDAGIAWRVMDDSQPRTASAVSGPDLQRNRYLLQQERLAASARCAGKAEDALRKAMAAISEDIPGRPPDTGLATAWAAIGQGWAVLAAA